VGLQPPKSPKLVFLSYKFAQKGKGYTPYAIFTKFGLVKEVSGTHSHTKFHRSGLNTGGYMGYGAGKGQAKGEGRRDEGKGKARMGSFARQLLMSSCRV